MTLRTPILAAACSALALATLPAAAQDSTGSQTAPQASPEAPTFDDALLERFVSAALEIETLRETFVSRVEAAETAETREALVEQAGQEMRAVVTSMDGLTLEQYRSIGTLAQSEPELAQRIVSMVEARRASDAPEGG